MAFNIPVVVTDGSTVVEGVRLPNFVADASVITTGIRLPQLVTDASQYIGIRLPKFGFSEAAPSILTVTTTGGVLVTGGADIVGEPIPVSGGVKVTGVATVSSVSVTIFSYNPLGGTKLTGAAANSFLFIEHKPSGGVKLTGAAVVSSVSLLGYIHSVSGGVEVSGEAYDPLHVMSGGITVSGAADIVNISVYTINAAGGVQVVGTASSNSALSIDGYGGVFITGGATITDNYPRFIPSGGVSISGEAVVVKLSSGQVLYPENPYNNLYSGWALSYEDNAPSRYEDLPMDSICTFDGETYISNAAGIYKLEKGTDAGKPIAASATILSNSDFESKNNKRVPYVYFGYISDDKMLVTIVTNKHESMYYDLMPSSEKSRGARAVLGRGLEGLYWTVRLSNVDGAFFELDNVTIDPVILRKMGV